MLINDLLTSYLVKVYKRMYGIIINIEHGLYGILGFGEKLLFVK